MHGSSVMTAHRPAQELQSASGSDHHLRDYNYNRSGGERPSLSQLDTTSKATNSSVYNYSRTETTPASASASTSTPGRYYDPVSDRPPASQVTLPSINEISSGWGYESSNRSSEQRRSPPSAFPRSPLSGPMTLGTEIKTPYPPMSDQQAYHHSAYSDLSPASTQNTLSPQERYSQAGSSRSSTQYDSGPYRQSTGHTPITDARSPMSAGSQAAFSPLSNQTSPYHEQRPYNDERHSPPMHPGPAVTGAYPCLHEECQNRPPFQTQYLLSSHQNVHKPDRPYYCPKPDCPRSRNGKPNSGFKRKNELIRHQLVHNSPGYACPFCTDRDHKYPRPDNLQRHVKVHHTDKSKDDPELRAILAQRIDNDKAGRRRRVNSSS